MNYHYEPTQLKLRKERKKEMAINDVLCAAAQKLGLKDTPIEAWKKKQHEIESAIRDNQDRLDELKSKVGQLDAQLRAKKREYDVAGPGVKSIIKREMGSLFKRLDRISEPCAAIADRIDSDQLLFDKIGMLIFAEENPTKTEEIEDIVCELKGWLDEQSEEGVVGKELGETEYHSQTETSEYDARIDAISEDGVSGSTQSCDELDERIAQMN